MSLRIVGISAAVGLAALALSGCVDDYGYYGGYYGGYGPVLYDYYGPGPYYGGYYYWSGGHRYYHRRGWHGHSGYYHGYYHRGYHGGGGHAHFTSNRGSFRGHGGHGGHGYGGRS